MNLIFCFCGKEHEATDQERRERKIQNSHPDQGKVRMLTREEWEEVQEVRPRTPFESKLARPHARIRTGEPLRLVSTHFLSSVSEMKFCMILFDDLCIVTSVMCHYFYPPFISMLKLYGLYVLLFNNLLPYYFPHLDLDISWDPHI